PPAYTRRHLCGHPAAIRQAYRRATPSALPSSSPTRQYFPTSNGAIHLFLFFCLPGVPLLRSSTPGYPIPPLTGLIFSLPSLPLRLPQGFAALLRATRAQF
ncbi:MAG: hypothetical protein IJA63_09650, partial [Akkermansia sp.]|nr:hypothetical protein [Akkermansia sp.]